MTSKRTRVQNVEACALALFFFVPYSTRNVHLCASCSKVYSLQSISRRGNLSNCFEDCASTSGHFLAVAARLEKNIKERTLRAIARASQNDAEGLPPQRTQPG